MSTTEFVCRAFSRMGAPLKIQGPAVRPAEKVRIDVSRDCGGEYFEIRCHDGVVPEVLDVRPVARRSGIIVMVTGAHPTGLTEPEYSRLIDTDPRARRMQWRRAMRRRSPSSTRRDT